MVHGDTEHPPGMALQRQIDTRMFTAKNDNEKRECLHLQIMWKAQISNFNVRKKQGRYGKIQRKPKPQARRSEEIIKLDMCDLFFQHVLETVNCGYWRKC